MQEDEDIVVDRERPSRGRIDQLLNTFNRKGQENTIPVAQLREMVEMERKIRAIESTFASLHSRASKLENKFSAKLRPAKD